MSGLPLIDALGEHLDPWTPTPLDRLRSRIQDTFTPDPTGSTQTFSCRICGMGPLTSLGRYAHLRRHDDAAREATRMCETVNALWTESVLTKR